ncbi:MAG: hypothetical protein JSR27_00105 [Proteobacteria bacterium]|nr:hypothetical protein [Pseudomonadota bacterium]
MMYSNEAKRSSVAHVVRVLGVCLVELLAWSGATAQTPFANPSFPLIADGTVNVAAVAANGSIVIGGTFTTVDGQPRQNIARLNANGTLDSTWNPGADGTISALAIDGAGNIYVGGNFGSIGGQQRGGLAKLSPTTAAADSTWNPAPDNYYINALAVDGSGANLYVVGAFQNIGGQARQYLAKLTTSSTGAADATWNPAPDDIPSTMALDPAGAIYVGGSFANIGGQARSNLAKLSPTGAGAADATWNPAPDRQVNSLAVDNTGAIFVQGNFANIGGQARSTIAKLSSSGTGLADATWNPAPSCNVYAMWPDNAGNVYVAGCFTSIGGASLNNLAKLSSTGTGAAETSWNPGSAGGIVGLEAGLLSTLVVNSSGAVVLGGPFDSVAGQFRRGLAIVSSSTGALLSARDTEMPGTVSAIIAQPSGGAIVGGTFNLAGTTPRNSLLRLNADGTLDPNWNPDVLGTVSALALDTSGRVYVGGLFKQIDAVYAYNLARVSGSGAGTVDTTWSPCCSISFVTALATDSTGNTYVSDQYSHLIRINSAGTTDSTWTPQPNGEVVALAVDSTGAIYAGGRFSNIGGQALQSIAKLNNTNGSADPNWTANPSSPVVSIALDNNGDVFAGGGKFSSSTGTSDSSWNLPCYSGYSDSGPLAVVDNARQMLYATLCFVPLARYSIADPAVDSDGWGAQLISALYSGRVSTIAVDATTGNVFFGGSFTSVNGQPRSSIAMLPPTVPNISTAERNALVALYTSTTGTGWTTQTNWNGAAGTECTWYGVQCLNGHVFSLNMQGNNLVGALPSLSAFSGMNNIYFDNNQLSGSIPALTGLSSLQYLVLDNNQLSGVIPSLAGLNSLIVLSLASNQLSGSIPALSGLSNLADFQAPYNQLTGSIPSLPSNIGSFIVSNNQLTGSLPTLPVYLADFEVSNNHLTGAIPSFASLASAGRYYLDHNQLTGSLPAFPSSFYGTDFNASHNQLTGSIPAFPKLVYSESVQYDVSYNQITGTLPDLSTLAIAYQIQFHAGHNLLTGSIPALDALSLTQFDVSNNQLTGTLPDLSTAKLLNFSVGGNRITGPVPNPPSPNNLYANGSSLCPNPLDMTSSANDAAWDTATGYTPWYATPSANNACDEIFGAAAGSFDQ